jgi:hypothetical protein
MAANRIRRVISSTPNAWIPFGLLALSATFLLGLIIRDIFSQEVGAALLAPLAVVTGVWVAVFTFIMGQRRSHSADLLEAALVLLERAFTVLVPKHESGRAPANERLTWLSAARLVRTAEKIGSQLTEASHVMIYSETKEYWRTRFRDVLFPSIDGFPSDYYAEKVEHVFCCSMEDRMPLSESSLAVLYRFAKWPDGVVDPIKDEPPFSEQEISHMQLFGPRHLGDFLQSVRDYKVEERKTVDGPQG